MKKMKTISKILMVLAGAMLIGQVNSYAAGDENPVHLKKSLTKKNDAGIYTITLETYVSGTSTVTTTEKSEPVDLCLVLDVSGSMNSAIPVETLTRITSGSLNKNTTYKIKITDGEGVENEYYLRRLSSWGTNYWCYGNTSDFSYSERVGVLAQSNNYSVGPTDQIFSIATTNKRKMDLLQDAVKDFIDVVAEKAAKEGVDHRISIIKYADDTYYHGQSIPNSVPSGSTEGEAYILEGNHRYGNSDHYNLTEVVKQFTAVNNEAGANALKTAIDELIEGGATSADYGMKKATYLFADFVANNPTRVSNKVVVMFTDGEPNHSRDFDQDVANAAIAASNTLKSTYNATVFSIGIFDSETTKIRNYMSQLSSNYNGSGVAVETLDSNGKVINYYQRSNGSDLSSIFKNIANSSVSDNSSKKLDTQSSAVVDIVSTNFSIPEGADNLAVSYKSYTGTDPEDPKCWSNDLTGYSITTQTPVIDHATSTVTVPGFNFGKADEWNQTTGALVSKGNWVGPRKINGTDSYWGLKMIISFDVKLDPEYEGGFDVPSNTAESGLYVQDSDGNLTPVGYYGIPTEDFPAICIIKNGLDINESAIFTATQTDGVIAEYRVPLIQRANNNSKLPCYAIVKGLEGGKNVTVSEQSWSWLYTKENDKTQTLLSLQSVNASKEDILKTGENVLFNTGVTNVPIARKKTYTKDGKTVTFAVLARESREGVWTPLPDKGDVDGIRQYAGAVVLLFEFTNEKNTSGKPARSEAYVHNKFLGGTFTNSSEAGAEAGGNEEEGLESGGNEEEGMD